MRAPVFMQNNLNAPLAVSSPQVQPRFYSAQTLHTETGQQPQIQNRLTMVSPYIQSPTQNQQIFPLQQQQQQQSQQNLTQGTILYVQPHSQAQLIVQQQPQPAGPQFIQHQPLQQQHQQIIYQNPIQVQHQQLSNQVHQTILPIELQTPIPRQIPLQKGAIYQLKQTPNQAIQQPLNDKQGNQQQQRVLVVPPRQLQQKQQQLTAGITDILSSQPSTTAGPLLSKLRSIGSRLKQEIDQYLQGFQQKKMNADELRIHKQAFKVHVTECYTTCSELPLQYPEILCKYHPNLAIDRAGELTAQQPASFRPTSPSSIGAIPSEFNEINQLINFIESTYNQYLITSKAAQQAGAQNMHPASTTTLAMLPQQAKPQRQQYLLIPVSNRINNEIAYPTQEDQIISLDRQYSSRQNVLHTAPSSTSKNKINPLNQSNMDSNVYSPIIRIHKAAAAEIEQIDLSQNPQQQQQYQVFQYQAVAPQNNQVIAAAMPTENSNIEPFTLFEQPGGLFQSQEVDQDFERTKKSAKGKNNQQSQQEETVGRIEQGLKFNDNQMQQLIDTSKDQAAQISQLLSAERYGSARGIITQSNSTFEMDEVILQMRNTIERALNPISEMQVTRDLLVEIVDVLRGLVRDRDVVEFVRADVQRIQENAQRLLSDKAASYNLYVELQQLTKHLKNRGNTGVASQQFNNEFTTTTLNGFSTTGSSNSAAYIPEIRSNDMQIFIRDHLNVPEYVPIKEQLKKNVPFQQQQLEYRLPDDLGVANYSSYKNTYQNYPSVVYSTGRAATDGYASRTNDDLTTLPPELMSYVPLTIPQYQSSLIASPSSQKQNINTYDRNQLVIRTPVIERQAYETYNNHDEVKEEIVNNSQQKQQQQQYESVTTNMVPQDMQTMEYEYSSRPQKPQQEINNANMYWSINNNKENGNAFGNTIQYSSQNQSNIPELEEAIKRSSKIVAKSKTKTTAPNAIAAQYSNINNTSIQGTDGFLIDYENGGITNRSVGTREGDGGVTFSDQQLYSNTPKSSLQQIQLSHFASISQYQQQQQQQYQQLSQLQLPQFQQQEDDMSVRLNVSGINGVEVYSLARNNSGEVSNSSVLPLKMKFFDFAMRLKEDYPLDHPIHKILVSHLWQAGQEVPTSKWREFILKHVNSVNVQEANKDYYAK